MEKCCALVLLRRAEKVNEEESEDKIYLINLAEISYNIKISKGILLIKLNASY